MENVGSSIGKGDYSNQLKYPWQRKELLFTLKVLADRSYQQKTWVEERDRALQDQHSLDRHLHFLFSDSVVADNPQAAIGFILYNLDEAHAIQSLKNAIALVPEALGPGATNNDRTLIESPEWESVLKTANAAYRKLLEKETS